MRTAALTLLALLVLGCSGDQGPTGPVGPAGPPGPGSIKVYEGPIPTSGHITVLVPELDLADMPLVVVYTRVISTAGQETWVNVNTYLPDQNGIPVLVEFALLEQGKVDIVSTGDKYRIVVVLEE